jgi:Putative Ig domain/Ricin-type beta-trefoil lectin domain
VRNIGKLGAAATAALVVLASPAPAAVAGQVAGPAAGPAILRACAAPASPDWAQCLTLVRTGIPSHLGASADVTPAGYGPASLQGAYGLTAAAASSGKGQTVALVDAYNDPAAAINLATYRSQYGLPPCTTATGCFRKVNQQGKTSPLPPAAGPTGWATEESLDLDMVSAICPNCRIVLVEANTSNLSDLGAAVKAAVALGAGFISNSYSAPEWSGDSTFESDYNHPGIVVTASAGDDGFGVEYPAASRYVTAVGGTNLTADPSTARGWKELAWGDGLSGPGDGTGSGCSAWETRPSWQTFSGCTHRAVADVAADADPNTGVAIYDSYDQSGWLEVGGTSAASPIIAATFALAGLPGRGDNPAWYLYQQASQLNDVTGGSNGSCSPAYLCQGGPGYDGPTGLGTPDGTAAFRAVSHTVTVTSPGTRSSVKGTTIKPLKITATDPDPVQKLTYRATGLPAGLSISGSTGVISGTPTKVGISKVAVSATDETGASGSVTFSWRVHSVGAIRSGLSSSRCIIDHSGRIEISSCGSTPQRWRLSPRSGGTVTIALAAATGTCMTVQGAGTASQTKVIAATCSTSTSQRWTIGSHGHLIGLHSGKCLADPAAGPNGTQLEIVSCSDTATSERWILP